MYTYLASTYGSSTYDSTTYNGATTSTGSAGSTSAGGSSGTTGLLSNTGFDIALITTLACVVALAAVAVRIWKRPSKLVAEVTHDQQEQR